VDIESFSKIIANAKAESREWLDLIESRNILEKLGIPLNKSGVAKTLEQALSVASEIGYPVAMKIISPDIIHKTEVGGVAVNIRNNGEMKEYFNMMMEKIKHNLPTAKIIGVLIEEMISGPELIIGTTTDQLFGHMLMFGIGGVLVELYKDVAFRLIPITKIDAMEMMDELRAKAILDGFRGSPRVDKEKLAGIMINISDAVVKLPEIVSLEVNPLVVTERGFMGLDARVIIRR